jgi:hypothetical protein
MDFKRELKKILEIVESMDGPGEPEIEYYHRVFRNEAGEIAVEKYLRNIKTKRFITDDPFEINKFRSKGKDFVKFKVILPAICKFHKYYRDLQDGSEPN